MRYFLPASILLVMASAAAAAEEPKRTVYLNNLVLEDLKKSNPRHYAEARKVMAASDSLCAPGDVRVWKVMNLPPVHCQGEFLKTSYPPKRQVSFSIDDTTYILLVTIKEARPEFHRLDLDDQAVISKPVR